MNLAAAVFWKAVVETPWLFFLRNPPVSLEERLLLGLLAEFYETLSDCEDLEWRGRMAFAVQTAIEHTYLITTDYARELIHSALLRGEARYWQANKHSGHELAKYAASAAGFFVAAACLEVPVRQVLRSDVGADIDVISKEIVAAVDILRSDLAARQRAAGPQRSL
jgi:hypothetical protein